MAEVDEIGVDGKPTGKKITPPRSRARICLRDLLLDITINGTQVFESAIITEKGPDQGVSRVVVNANPANPYTPAIRQFAENTLQHFGSFVYFWRKLVLGHGESTTKHLVNCCYTDIALLASSSEWDPVLKKATPVYASRRDKWHASNAHLDIKKKSRKSTDSSGTTPSFLGNCAVEMDDAKKLELINGLNYKHGVNLHNKQAEGGVSVLTGAEMTTNTAATSVNSINLAQKSKSLALQLAQERAQKAERLSLRVFALLLSRFPPTIVEAVPPPSEVDRGRGVPQGS
jgi:hypothetical protein